MPFEWLAPWHQIEDKNQQTLLKNELLLEVSEGDVLWVQSFDIIVMRDDQDDFLVELSDSRVAEVHLSSIICRGRESQNRMPAGPEPQYLLQETIGKRNRADKLENAFNNNIMRMGSTNFAFMFSKRLRSYKLWHSAWTFYFTSFVYLLHARNFFYRLDLSFS